jgi:hypothetical protein
MCRLPGGFCLFLGEAVDDCGELIYRIWHPSEGYLEDASYYYDSIEHMLETKARRENCGK